MTKKDTHESPLLKVTNAVIFINFMMFLLFWVDESPGFISPIANEISVKDFDGNEIGSFILSGADKDFFMIENGNLKFKNPVDFETQSTYSLHIIALDKLRNSEIKSLTITIHDGKTNIGK